jgi:hypothetical protein
VTLPVESERLCREVGPAFKTWYQINMVPYLRPNRRSGELRSLLQKGACKARSRMIETDERTRLGHAQRKPCRTNETPGRRSL